MFTTDKRTLAAMNAASATNDFATFPHGLGKTPDAVFIRWNQTFATAAAVAQLAVLFDASNVSLRNIGSVASPTMEVCTIVFHSIIV